MPVVQRRGQPIRPSMPTLGVVRLGINVPNRSGQGTHPQATEHFVLRPPEDGTKKDIPYAEAVADVFGDKVKELYPVIIPVEDEEVIASHYFRLYTKTWGRTCYGDGVTAERKVDVDATKEAGGEAIPASHVTKNMVRKIISCPCHLLEDKECRETLYLWFMLPTVPGLGVWQTGTRSPNSADNIHGCFKILRAVTASPEYPNGRIAGIPLKLSLVPEQRPSDEGGMRNVFLLHLEPLDVVPIAEFRQKLVSYSRPALPEPDITEQDLAELPFEEPERAEGAIVMPPATEQPADAPPAADPPQPTADAPPVVEGTSRPVEDAPTDDPPPEERPAKPLDHNDVFKCAEGYGYRPQKVPSILGSSTNPLTIPKFIAGGGTYEEAIEKVRQYAHMDQGSR